MRVIADAGRSGHRARSGLILAACVLAVTITGAGVTAKKSALVTIPATFEVKAAPAQAWKLLSSASGFGTLTGFVPDPSETGRSFTALGDALPATVWGDRGTLIATQVVREKELRVTWEPESGGYLCAKRLVFTPVAGGTKIEYWDRYTDDQSGVDETAAKVAKATDAGIAKIRALLDK